MRLNETPTPVPPARSHARAWIIAAVILIPVLLFVWRTATYYRQIVRGEVDVPATTFASALSIDQSIAGPLPQGDIDMSQLLSADDPQLGAEPSKALVTIVEFADFGCPFSREASYIVRALADHTDIVHYVYRDFPIVELHPNADLAAEAGECAHDQGRFFDYHDKLYQNQFDLSQDKLKQYAQEIGLDARAFNTCLDGRVHRQEVEEDRLAGVGAGVRGTPTFFMNGVRIPGAIPQDIFSVLLDRFTQVDTSLDG